MSIAQEIRTVADKATAIVNEFAPVAETLDPAIKAVVETLKNLIDQADAAIDALAPKA